MFMKPLKVYKYNILRVVFCSILSLVVGTPLYGIDIYRLGVEEGLSQLSVLSITQDSIGRMWFGTEEGLNCYDGSRIQTFQTDIKVRGSKNSINNLGNYTNYLTASEGSYLFFSSDSRLICYNQVEEVFEDLEVPVTAVSSSQDTIWFANNQYLYSYVDNLIQEVFSFDEFKRINCIQKNGSSILLGTSSGLYQLSNQLELKLILPSISIASIFIDSKSNIWVATRSRGIYFISQDTGKVQQWTINSAEAQASLYLKSNDIRCMVEDDYQQIWIGTFKGLSLYDLKSGQFIASPIDNQLEKLSHESIYSLYKDRQGNIWVGTYYGGVNYFHPNKIIYSYYTAAKNLSDRQLSSAFVGDMVEDQKGNLWICTEGGGLNKLDLQDNKFEHFMLKRSDNKSVQYHLNLKSIVYDAPTQQLFIGTHTGGLVAFDLYTRKFRYLSEENSNYKQKLGTQVDHLQIYKRILFIQVKGAVYTYQIDNPEKGFIPLFNDRRYENYWIRTFFIDSKGNIWLAGYDYLSSINIDNPKQRKIFRPQDYDYGRFSITSFAEDSDGQLYLGTRGSGLYSYQADKDMFCHFTAENKALWSNYCYDIHFTDSGKLLILGDKGVVLFDTKEIQSELLSFPSKIKYKGFNIGSKIYKNSKGTLFMGSTNGLISFQEEDLSHEYTINHLYFSALYIDNKLVSPNGNQQALSTALPFAKKIKLKPTQTHFSIQFASNNYLKTNKSGVYEYKLEGLDKDWIVTSLNRISYTNLNYGKYKLLLREKMDPLRSYGVPQQAELQIHLQSPFYLSTPFKVGVVILLLLLVLLFLHIKTKQMQLANSLHLEKEKKNKIKEWDVEKTKFFTMISHEFKTPLTLIISHIDLLISSKNLTGSFKTQMERIRYNAESLKELSAELVLFERLQQKALKLAISTVDILPVLTNICQSFQPLAESKAIKLTFTKPTTLVELSVDLRAFKKIIINLLENALKYTSEGGSVDLVVYEDASNIKIQVIDTGRGISIEEQDKIFNYYYRSRGEAKNLSSHFSGNGLGLALVKHLIDLHKGTISVKSAVNYGTIFTVCFKKGKRHSLGNNELISAKPTFIPTDYKLSRHLASPRITDLQGDSNQGSPLYTMLIIGSNEEVLSLLYDVLSPLYHVVKARNGQEGWTKITEQCPDIIIADAIMPQMDGYELSRRMKNSIYCDIPIMLLTTSSDEEHQNKAFASKADAFMAKPFGVQQLVIRCNSLLDNALQVRKKYTAGLAIAAEQQEPLSSVRALTREDVKFMDEVDELIEKHYQSEDFVIDNLIELMYISRTLFYERFKTLNDISPSEYLRIYRLKKAASLLLEKPELAIAEIAYKVGYSSSKYFSKSFKKYYNSTPSDFRANSK